MADSPKRPEIATDYVCRIILKARQFAAKESVVEEDDGGNPVDEGFREVLADRSDDPVYEELRTFISDLNVDEQAELIALMYVGRGDFSGDEWEKALEAARELHASHVSGQTASYLLETPLLADHLEDGLVEFDLSCDDFDAQHL
jgi:hypothetical protein